jgi:hypothetical protein
MRISLLCRWAVGLISFVLLTASASAQTFESIGTRAQGMGGAFVAVADDATASWWNPAGLASGATLNILYEHGRITEPDNTSGFVPASQTTPNAFAAAFPSLGLSYYRLHISQIRPQAPLDTPAGGVALRAIAFSQFGATVGQSFGPHFVLGSTAKLVKAGAVVGTASPGVDGLEAANNLDIPQTRRGDLDLGLMAMFGRLKAGLSVKNVIAPDFGAEAGGFKLARQGRAGVAFLTPASGRSPGFTIAFDADLTRNPTIFGDVRHIATGGEVSVGSHVSARGGFTANTIGARRPAWSAGLSFALTRGLYVDVSRVWGTDETLRAWSTTVRLAF